VRRTKPWSFAHDLNLARSGFEQTQKAIHGCGLTRAVLSYEGEEIAVSDLQAQAIQRMHLLAEKAPSKMHVKTFRDNHIAPEQKRLLRAFTISSSGLSLKSSLANAFLIFFEVAHVQP